MAAAEPLPIPDARAGLSAAWDTLFRRYQLPIYVYVFELLHEEQSALDVVQETFVSAVRHLGTLRDDAKFGSWLFGIAHQKCLQHFRKQGRREILQSEQQGTDEDPAPAPDELLIRQEQEEAFMKLLGELPVSHRAALLLHYVEDFSLEEISAVMAVPVGTVKSRLYYAKSALRKRLKGELP